MRTTDATPREATKYRIFIFIFFSLSDLRQPEIGSRAAPIRSGGLLVNRRVVVWQFSRHRSSPRIRWIDPGTRVAPLALLRGDLPNREGEHLDAFAPLL